MKLSFTNLNNNLNNNNNNDNNNNDNNNIYIYIYLIYYFGDLHNYFSKNTYGYLLSFLFSITDLR